MKESMGLDKSSCSSKISKFILGVFSKYDKDYWLYITIDINCTLQDLDQFLRDIWVECCGHLSAFEIHGESYESQADEEWGFGESSNDMNVKLKNVTGVNDKIQYEYDFGSTTYLEIKVVSEITCSRKGKNIEIIARNNEPELKCSNCGNKAEYYDYENEEYLCADCFENYTGDEDMVEEVDYVNSPRAGVCGYHGSKEDEVQYLPNIKNEKVITVRNFGKTLEKEDNDTEEDDNQSSFEGELRSNFDKIARKIINAGLKKELKKWEPIEENFSLEYHLARLTKAELINIARNLYIDKISNLNKEKLKNKILELYEERAQFLIENVDVERFQFLLDLAQKRIHKNFYNNIEINDIDYFRDRAFLFTGTVYGEDAIIMPEKLQKIILNKNNKDFKKQMEKNEELIKLFWGMCSYYGVVELDTFEKLVKKYIDFDISDMNLSVILENGAAYYDEFDFNGYLGKDGIVDDASHILSEQYKRSNVEFYPFKKEELLAAARIDFKDNTGAYKKLYDFLISNFDMDGDKAEDLIFSLEADIKNDVEVDETISNLLSNFDISNINEVKLITNEIIKFANNTRQWVIKGYTPAELNPITVIK